MDNLQQRIYGIFKPVIVINGEQYCDIPSKEWEKMPSQVDKVQDAVIIEEFSNSSSPKLHHIAPSTYKELAIELRDRIDGREYITDEIIEVENDCTIYQLIISAHIYHRHMSAPDGCWTEISDIIPIWYEMHTLNGLDMSDRQNDFDFEKLKKQI